MPVAYPDSFYKLSEQESQLVEDKYEHIERTGFLWFDKLKGLVDVDDLIQLCAIGFIKSLKTYDEERGYFNTHARHKMDAEVIHYVTCNKTRFKELHLEDYNPENMDLSEYDNKFKYNAYNKIIKTNENIEDEIINKIHNERLNEYKEELIKKYGKKFKDRDLNIITLFLCDEIKQVDLAKQYQVSRQRIGQIITKFRKLSKNKIIQDRNKLQIS